MKPTEPAAERSSQQQYQADYYNNLAGDFDAKCRRENSNHLYKIEQIAATFFRHLDPARDGYDFLELGTGTGIHAQHFLTAHAGRINSFTLTDISANMLQQAAERLRAFAEKTSFLVMPAESFATERHFDGIFVSGSMHHFADPVAALAEMKRHLKPGGMVVICEPVVWNPVNLVKALREFQAEQGQFRLQRRRVRRELHSLGYRVVTDRVLHYRSGHSVLRKAFPYAQLEKIPLLDPLAIMYLFGAQVKG